MRLLTICPSKNRPGMLYQMQHSFKETIQGDTTLLVVEDDLTITECFNNAFKDNPDYDFYHLTNDDTVYKTIGWDKLLCNKGKISYGNDTIHNEALCTFPVIDGDIVRALGWLQAPNLLKYCGDLVWMHIGNRAKCLNHVPEVTIEHLHFINNKRDNDDPKFWETYEHDKMQYLNWEANNGISDVRKVRTVLYGHPNYTEVKS